MRIEASTLRIADVIRVPGYGEGEVARRQEAGPEVRVWFRGREDEDKPSMVFDGASSVEVARPGSLFRFKPPLAPRSKRIVDALTPLGWTFHAADAPGGTDHLHDALDMTRVEFQSDRVVVFVRSKTADGWTWPASGLVLGTLDDFTADFENQISKLEATSLLAQWEREADDKPRIKTPVPDLSTLPRPVKSRPVIVRYSEAEGVLLCGDTKTHKEVIKKLAAPYRFRYSKRLPAGCAWYVQRTRGTVQAREKLEAVVAVLRGRGVPVELDYVAPDSKLASPVAEQHRPAAGPAPTLRAVPTEPAPRVQVEARGPGRPADRERQAEKLREIAARLISGADETIGAERLENTRRRADMASGIRARAYSEKVVAGALMLAADEVERGELTYIARLTTRPQIDDLEAALRDARYARTKQSSERLEDEPELADIPFARFTGVAVWKSDLRELMTYASDRVDAGRRKRMRPLAEGEDQLLELIGDDVELVRAFLVRDGKEKLPTRIEWIADRLKRYDRLGRLGIRDTASLRAALREYLGCCRGHQKRQADDPLAAAKRELRFAKIPGFFPTPRPLAEQLVSLAAIEPGMRVLEPSAGSGSIAEAIREQHPGVALDVIEFNMTLRGLLQAQGFALVDHDFLSFAPDRVRYDRIVMNPPFEKRQDTRHIAHAIDLLAPGGRLVAIASGSLPSRGDKESVALRERIEALGGRIEQLPAGSFAASGTDVHTVVLVVDAPAAKAAKPRPALAVVPTVAPEPEPEADCGCEHAEPEPTPAPAPKRKTATKLAPAAAPPPARAPTVTATTGPIDTATIGERWKAAEERRHAQKIWKNIPKTSCFEIRDGDEDSVTLCPAFQPKPIGDCPPMSLETPTFGLCEQGEPVEYFARGKENKGVIAAKAEGLARFTQARDRRVGRGEFDLGELPAGDDFDALQTYLDRLVPSRVVYRPAEPFVVIDVRPEQPAIVTPEGERLPLWTSSPIPAESRLEPRVDVRGPMPLVAFVEQLGSGDLVAYRGPVDAEVLRKVVNLASADIEKLASAGGSIADVQHGRVGDRSVYWLAARRGSRIYGPITATGGQVSGKLATDFAVEHRAPINAERPPGWDPNVTIAVALRSKGRPFGFAWNRETGELQTRERGEWKPRDPLPATSTEDPEKGFADFPHVATATMLKQLEQADRSDRFHVSGAWLGILWPSDFGKRVEFDPPTGGALDLDEARARYANQVEFTQMHPSPTQERKIKLEAARLKWAERWLRDQQQAARKAEQAVKPKREPKPKPKPRPKLAVVPAGDVDHDRDQEQQPMKKTSAKKKTAKAKPTAKKAGAKKAASKPAVKKAPAKKASAKKKAASKPAAKKAPAKKAPSKPVAKPAAAKVIAPKSAGPACETTDNTCPPDLESWRNRLRQGDRVRFRKNSKIAAALGIRTDRVFEIRCTVCRDGERFAILDLGVGAANDVAIPVGQFAVVERAEEIPEDVRECVAKLAKLDAQLTPQARRLVAKLAQRR